MSQATILPDFLQERLETLGYKCVRVLSPSINAYAIELTQNNHQLNVFVKCLDNINGENGEQSDRKRNENAANYAADLYFANEVTFYGHIIPQFLALERNRHHQINVPFSCIPTCHHVEDTFLMLDNLMAAGYRALDVKKSMPYECARVVLQQLARFHAFSMALKHHQPDLFNSLGGNLHETMQIDRIFMEGVQDALKLAKQSFPMGSTYVEKLSYFVLDVLNTIRSKQKLFGNKDESHMHMVITHGDLWPNNILVKMCDSKMVDNVVFVDFQGCRLASPVNDLMSVLLLAIDKDTRNEHRAELLDCYYSALTLKLDELGLTHEDIEQVFSEQTFRDQLQKHSRFAFAMGLVGLPLYIQEDSSARTSDNEEELHNFNGNEVGHEEDPVVLYFRKLRAKKSMKCKNKMLELIMDAIDHGYLD